MVHSLTRLTLIAALMTGVAACSGSNEPLIDRTGVADDRYKRDLAACQQQSSPLSFVSLSNPVASCMTGKGYKVLMGR